MVRVIRGLVVLVMLVWALPGLALAQDDDPVGIAQALIDNLLLGDFEAATSDFDATMQGVLTPDALAQTWESLLEQVGAFEEQLSVVSTTDSTLTLVTIAIQFERIALDFQVSIINADGQISGFYIQQHEEVTSAEYVAPGYADPAAFAEHGVTINAGTEWELPGTLTLPVGEGPFPAVVLVHGSGPQDRDESYGPRKPFNDLAWGLASQGIAVLRYDKRTYVHGRAMAALESGTVQEETIDDALAAVALLQTTKGIDPARVIVLGHSLGGYLGPRIAAQSDGIAGLVIVAGNSRPLEDLILEQTLYLMQIQGEVTPENQAQFDAMKAIVETIKALESPDDASADELLGIPAAYWLDLQSYDPLVTVQTLAIPVLVLQGERDYQVTMTDFQGWQDALAGSDDAMLITYPALDHLLVAGEGLSSSDDYTELGNVDETVIVDIADWVLALD